MRMLSITLTALLLIGAIASVGAAPKGSLKIAGSTTVLPLSQIWAERFMGKYPDVSISLSGGGSGTGLSMLVNGTCDIANASREAKPKEIDSARARNYKLVGTKLAKDGLAVVVHPSNNVKNLTMDQLKAIYRGTAATWREVGGDSARNIVVVGRDSSSGTYGFFQEVVLGGAAYRKDMLSQATSQAVVSEVARSKDAIGYVGMAYAEEFERAGRVRIVSLSRKKGEPGLLPTPEMVASGRYPLFRFLYAYTLGSPRGLAREFLNWCTGPEGQALVTEAGYLPIR